MNARRAARPVTTVDFCGWYDSSVTTGRAQAGSHLLQPSLLLLNACISLSLDAVLEYQNVFFSKYLNICMKAKVFLAYFSFNSLSLKINLILTHSHLEWTFLSNVVVFFSSTTSVAPLHKLIASVSASNSRAHGNSDFAIQKSSFWLIV